MADNFSDWYMGSMAPPLRLPGGGYAPAPSASAPASIDEIYRGIYGPSVPGLSAVSRPTVPVNSQTGMPYTTTASAKGGAGVGHGYAASGSATYAAPRAPSVANPVRDLGVPQYGIPGTGGGVLTKSGFPPGATVDKTYTAPLVPKPLVAGSARGSASLGAGGFGSGALSLPPRVTSAPVHQLNVDVPADEGQYYADSLGMPVRSKSGTVFQPKGGAQTPQQQINPQRAAASAPARFGGLFGGLFGGGQGGLFGGGARPANGMVPGIGVATAAAAPAPGPAIYTPSGNVHPGSFYDNSGNDMAHMPKAYQDNPRNSNGGY